MRIIKLILTGIVLLFFWATAPAFSQETRLFSDPDALYKKALDLYKSEKYGSAQKMFQNAILAYQGKESDFRTNAEYYTAICAIELENNDAEYLITQFIYNHPESQMVNDAYMNMARYQYREKKYEKSVYWFEEVDKNQLTKEDLAEYYFKLGYSYFMEENNEKANLAFYEIKDINTKYTAPALYYYSHINYSRGNYQTALQGFEKLTENTVFAAIVPYYITQIYYLQKKYDKVLSYAPELLENANTKRAPEIARVIGEAYLSKKDYKNALTYLEMYKEKSSNLLRNDNYEIGLAYYMNQQYDKATDAFENVTTQSDSISQSAYFYLADCYLRANEKQKASLAFEAASKMSFIPSIEEEALFNYAKITFELYYSPFNNAIEAFQAYIAKYPKSRYTDEAYNYLVLAFMNAKNYKDALESLEKIQDKDNEIKKAYQKIAFYRGLELFNNLDFEGAIVAFDKSLEFPYFNRTLKAKAHYWKAEAFYRLENYEGAISNYNDFLLSNGAFGLEEYALAHYNLGYANFKIKNYDEAISWYRKYINVSNQNDKIRLGDTYNRVGDAQFKQKHYWAAIEFYDRSVALAAIDADYALYQRAFSLGLLNRPEKKIESLNELLDNYTESNYLDDALYEMGRSYQRIDNSAMAISSYKRVISDFPGSSFERKSLLQLGLVYYNTDKLNEALEAYMRLIKDYPNSEESSAALTGVKNIYVDKNNVDAYFAYIKELGKFDSVSQFEKDSLSYVASEKVYMTGDYGKAVRSLDGYISNFPSGRYMLNAQFYLADSYIQTGQIEEALGQLQKLTTGAKNSFTIPSLEAMALLQFSTEKYLKAYDSYTRLEESAEQKSTLLDARLGQLNSAVKVQKPELIIQAADKVIFSDNVPEENMRMAHFEKAKALMQTEKYELAKQEFTHVAGDVKTTEGAEAKYLISKIYFIQEDYTEAEEEIFDFVQKNTSHQYWLAKSFILLSEIYVKKDDDFQAKATLQSIIDNYQKAEDGIIDEANVRLMEIVKREKERENQSSEEEIEINIQDVENTGFKVDSLNKTVITDTLINNQK